MATREVLDKFVENKYESLPARLRSAVSCDEWQRHVVDYCVTRGLPWESPARNVCDERQYYEQLLLSFRSQKRAFPYHLGEYVCRVLRVTPFAFYCDILVDNMKTDSAYDAIPNFTAADIADVVGVGRNQYIDIINRAKSKMLWRVSKGLVRDLLPDIPRNTQPRHPFWTVCVVNLGEVEYRTMSEAEAEVCRMAAKHVDGVPYSEVNASAVASLYVRGLVWFHIPIDASDHVTIPPLEGFVSNKTASISIDPLETLLYQIFVAASESVTVSELADILDTSVENVKVGISMACRLGFCNKMERVSVSADRLRGSPTDPTSQAPHFARNDLLDDRKGGDDGKENGTDRKPEEGSRGLPRQTQERKSTAFVVDSAITGFLMMGALTPEVKKHSVTLFEGGRVYGAGVIDELIEGLESSVEMSKDFEGEMLELGRTSRSMAAVLKCLRAASSTELLRKESIEQLADKEQAERILVRSHDVLICAAGLKGPALPLKEMSGEGGPTLFGPSPLCLTPWINLALYTKSGMGPKSIVMPAGTMLETDRIFHGATKVLIWRWDDAHTPQTLNPRDALFEINSLLQLTALMIQPIGRSNPPESTDPSMDVDQTVVCEEPVFVPLPFSRNSNGSVDAFTATDGQCMAIQVSSNVESALEVMGILHNVGYVSFLAPHGHVNNHSGDQLDESGGPPTARRALCPWVPLGVAIGIPLHPVPLCEAVCQRLTAGSFLTEAALKRQRGYSATLDACIRECSAGKASPYGWPETPIYEEK